MASPFLTADEEKLLDIFTKKVNIYRHHEDKTALSKDATIKFLMARKFDYQRSVELYLRHEQMRAKEGLFDIDVQDPALLKELFTEKFTVLSGRDNYGAGIALFTARLHYPADTTHQVVLKALLYILDTALQSHETQRHGLVFIYNMLESKYSNFDFDLSIKILNLLKGAYPARLKKVLIVGAPLWFKAPFKVLRLFVREKLQDRVYIVSQVQLLQHLPIDSMPEQFGGNLLIDHRHWLHVCFSLHQADSLDILNSYFVSRKRCSMGSSSDNSEFVNTRINDAGIDSADFKETLSEKHSNEEGEKGDSIVFNGSEKELNVEKEDGRNNLKQRHSSEFQVSHNFNRKSRDIANSHIKGSNSIEESCPTFCKNRPLSTTSSASDFSIHMAEEGGMTIQDLVKHVKEKGRKGLFDEYAEIRREEPKGTFNVCRAKYNVSKNRYSDVPCYDHSRVVLPEINGDPSSDYINANYVDGYMQKNAYICTQGPFASTLGDFWRLVWLSECVTIVMTTKTAEKGRVKCGQYWPVEKDTDEQYDEYIVTNTGMEQNQEYAITSLQLHNTVNGQMKQIKHLQFTNWPDFGIPPTTGFLDFLLRVRACQADSVKQMVPSWQGHPNGPPMVIHCSAGIGRTGTFINTDISLHRLEDIHTVNICETVQRIRTQRAFSIQMPDQYVFCHLAVIDYAMKVGMLPETTRVVLDSDSDGFD